MTASTDNPDITAPAENTDAIDRIEPADPIDPTDRTEPTEPIESTDPLQPMQRNESCDAIDHFEVPASVSTAEILSPGERGAYWLHGGRRRTTEPADRLHPGTV